MSKEKKNKATNKTVIFFLCFPVADLATIPTQWKTTAKNDETFTKMENSDAAKNSSH